MKRLVLLIIFLVIAILLFNTLTRKKQKHYPTKENCEDAEKKFADFHNVTINARTQHTDILKVIYLLKVQ